MNQDLEGRVERVSIELRKMRAQRMFAFVTGVFFIRMGKIREEEVLIIICVFLFIVGLIKSSQS